MMETMKLLFKQYSIDRDFTARIKSIVTPDELQRQLSNEPKVYFTERELYILFIYSEETIL